MPLLTTKVAPEVTNLCKSSRAKSPIPFVCPPLVPVSRYRHERGFNGVQFGNTNRPAVKPPADRFYLLGFNGGFNGPIFWHWMAGMGTPEAIRYWVLSDKYNEVKGKPRRIAVRTVEGRRVEIWRFPDYPAGGPFGGHVAAMTRSGPYLAFASIHGFDSGDADARMAVALARKADAQR